MGPNQASIFSYDRAYDNDNKLIVGTYFGGLYQTSDRGHSWTPVLSPFSNITVFASVYDPQNSDVIYVGTFAEGIYKSIDNGVTWSQKNNGLNNDSVNAIAIDPFNSNLVIASTSLGLYRSENGGDSWLICSDTTSVSPRSLLFDITTPGKIYMGALAQGLFVTLDGGLSWAPVLYGVGQTDVHALTSTPSGDTVFAATSYGLFQKVESNISWESITYDLPLGAINHAAVDPKNGRLFAATSVGVFTLDRQNIATNWVLWSKTGTRFIMIDPAEDFVAIASTYSEFLASDNDGATFVRLDTGIQNLFVGALSGSVHNEQAVMYSGSDLGVHHSATFFGGDNETLVSDSLFDQGVFSFASHPQEQHVLFAGTEKAGVWRSSDWGVTWAQKSNGIVPSEILSLSQSAVSPYTMYAGTNTGVYISRDDGLYWEIATNFAISTQILSVYADATLPGVAYFATLDGGIFKTIDDGVSFQSASIGLPGEVIKQIVSSPFGNVYALTYSGGLYVSHNEGGEWFPTATDVTETILTVTTDTEVPWIAYLGTSGGGVYQTTNNAISWAPINTGLNDPYVFTLQVDPTDRKVLFAGCSSHLYRWESDSAVWTEVSAIDSGSYINSMVIDPDNAQLITLSVPQKGIYQSLDGGTNLILVESSTPFIATVPMCPSFATYQKFFVGSKLQGLFSSSDLGLSFQNASNGMTLFVRGLAIDRHNEDHLISGSLAGGMFNTLDGGENWSSIGLTDRIIFHTLMDVEDQNTYYAATTLGVAKTEDQGASWIKAGQQSAYVFSMQVHPVNRDILFIGSLYGNVYRSDDGGQAWVPAKNGLPETNIIALAFDQKNDRLYAAAQNSGIYYSVDLGAHWLPCAHEVVGGFQITALTVDNANGYLYAAATDAGFYRSKDLGVSFEAINNGFVGDVASIITIDPFDGSLWGSALNQAGNFKTIFRSVDNGDSWALKNTGVLTESVIEVFPSPFDGAVVYATTADGLYQSLNDGLNWSKIGTGLDDHNVVKLLFDPNDSESLFLGTGQGLLHSSDGGTVWNPLALPNTPRPVLHLGWGATPAQLYIGTSDNGLYFSENKGITFTGGVEQVMTNAIVTYIVQDPTNSQILYSAASGVGLLKSVDGGSQWAVAGNDTIDNLFILAIAIDPVDTDTIYVGTTGDGIYVSHDGGEYFEQDNIGLFNTNITSLYIDPTNHKVLYAGTEGGGVFRKNYAPVSIDSDGDGVPDTLDCAIYDPNLASLHYYYIDADNDHYGDPGGLTSACALAPEPPLVSWGNDPLDTTSYEYALIEPKGDRKVGMTFDPNEQSNEVLTETVIDFGVDAINLSLTWAGIETNPTEYLGEEIPLLNAAKDFCQTHQLEVNLTISPIVFDALTVPIDLRNGLYDQSVRWNDPVVIARFKYILTYLHHTLGDVPLAALQIGHEVDGFMALTSALQFWLDYHEFFLEIQAYAKQLWDDTLPVGVTWTVDGYLNEDYSDYRDLFSYASDHISLTYLPKNDDYTIIEPTFINEALEQILSDNYLKPLYFQKIAFPSAPITSSSTTKQSQFIKSFFDFWDRVGTAVPYVCFCEPVDRSLGEGVAILEASQKGTVSRDDYPIGASYYSSLGLRAVSGAKKPAYKTLQNSLFNRGWWRDVEIKERSYYLGFTGSQYDLAPDLATQLEATEWLQSHIRAYGDMTALHLDGGIPWTEAYADDFSSSELPYSEGVKGTLNLFRESIPEGHRLFISVNPLGIPRQLLAPYWGVGSGYDYDDAFNRIPTGVINDSDNRALPAPWDSYSFNDEPVKIAYLNFCKRIIDYYNPDYLLVGIEVSATLIADPVAYEKYVELHKFIYESLKGDVNYAHVPILVSFSATTYMIDEYGVAYKKDEQEPGVRERVLDEFEKMLPYTDVIGLSLYPHYGKYNAYEIPAFMFDEIYDMIARFDAADKPIAITECGYTGDNYDLFTILFSGSEEKQHRFYKLLFRELARHPNPVEFVINFKVRDGDHGWQRQYEGSIADPPTVNPTFVEFYKYFRDIGIFDGDGVLRAGGYLWEAIVGLPHVTATPAKSAFDFSSPNGKLRLNFEHLHTQEIKYNLKYEDDFIFEYGNFGLLVDEINLGDNIVSVQYSTPVLKSDTVAVLGGHDATEVEYNESTFTFNRSGDSGDDAWSVIIRLYNGGFAYRYVVPGTHTRIISGEPSSWTLPSNSLLWYQNDVDAFEGNYEAHAISDSESIIGMPLLMQVPSGQKILLSEVNNIGYSGLRMNTYVSGARVIAPSFQVLETWDIAGGEFTPWRVATISDGLDDLVSNGLIAHLSDPPYMDAYLSSSLDWVMPGRALWSSFVDSHANYDMNEYKNVINQAALLNFEYVVIDMGWETHFANLNYNNIYEALHMLVQYADSKGVKIFVGKALLELFHESARQIFFEAMQTLGVAGVVIETIYNEYQIIQRLMPLIFNDAATFELMIVLNKGIDPAGKHYTFPNVMGFDNVKGLDANLIGTPLTPQHNATLPFTAMVVGPTAYKPVLLAPDHLGGTTYLHQISFAGILNAPFQSWIGNPEHILDITNALDVIRLMPTVWDETILLDQSEVGKQVVMARRSGALWFLFAINGKVDSDLSLDNLDLSFLGSETYDMIYLSDETAFSFTREEFVAVNSSEAFTFSAMAGGGFIACFYPPETVLPSIYADPMDIDEDGIANDFDCNPFDPSLSTMHTFYLDEDGDQLGDPNSVISVCSTKPFAGYAVWGNDPDDHSYIVGKEIIAKGDRTLGIDLIDAVENQSAYIDYAHELGAETIGVTLNWGALETTPGLFDGPQTETLSLLSSLVDSGFKISLTVSPFDGDVFSVPYDLLTSIYSGAVYIDDAVVVDRFNALLDHIYTTLGSDAIASLQIGQNIDLFFPSIPEAWFWALYKNFVAQTADHVKTTLQPNVKVGITATLDGLLNAPTKSILSDLNEVADFISVTYLPYDDQYYIVEPAQAMAPLTTLLAQTSKPIHIARIGYSSSPAVGSSETKQSQFYFALIDFWDDNAVRVPFIQMSKLFDVTVNSAQADLISLTAGGLSDTAFNRLQTYVQTLGVRDNETSLEAKSAFYTLRNLTLQREWWQVPLPQTRSFLLGITPVVYDEILDGDIIVPVIDDVMATVGGHADMVTYHFDSGVPWQDALADTFASETPPYSADLISTWDHYFSRHPEGYLTTVSVNPLGVPRDDLAPYWGYGESFYLNDQFEPVGRGVFYDKEKRLLTAPFSTAKFNDDIIKTAYWHYIKRVIQRTNPLYLVTGLEANLLLEGDNTKAADYLELQQYIYEQIKSDPETAHVNVVVSVTAEFYIDDEFGVPLLVDLLQQPSLREKHLSFVESISPYIDVLGISIYPVKTRFGTSLIPTNLFEDLFKTFKSLTDKPFAITETGYPSTSFSVRGIFYESTMKKQADYQKFLLAELQKENDVIYLSNYSTHDITPRMDKLRHAAQWDPPFENAALIDFFQIFEFIGLFNADGSPKLSLTPWDDIYAKSVVQDSAWLTPIVLESPDGKLSATISVDGSGDLSWQLSRDGMEIIEPSHLGLLINYVDLGSSVTNIESSESIFYEESYPLLGVHEIAESAYLETTISVRRVGAGDEFSNIRFRLFNDGFAFSYEIPGTGDRYISGETTTWSLPYNSHLFQQTNTRNYEGFYRDLPAGSYSDDIGAPLTTVLPDDRGYLMISEAALTNYSGLTFKGTFNSLALQATFLDDVSWILPGGSYTPWRALITVDTLDELVNSDLISNLNLPYDPALFPEGVHTEWIKPGRALWTWWTDTHASYSYDAQIEYIDYASEMGFEYILVDAGWEEPDGFQTETETTMARLKSLVQYGHSKGVGVFVWKTMSTLLDETARQKFIADVKWAGVAGIKIDNLYLPTNESIDLVRFYENILIETAEQELMMNFHGCPKATGLQRTYPNLITYEGFLGLELNVMWWEAFFLSPYHNSVLPFVRFVAGPGDYTPVTFDTRKLGDTTLAHQLATAGIFTSPLTHFVDDPEIYLGHVEVLDVLKTIPTVWDETIVMPQSDIGDCVAFARRKGSQWFMFMLNGSDVEGKTFTNIDLSFLGNSVYDVILIGDQTATSFKREMVYEIDQDFSLDVSMLSGGGFVAKFTPATIATTAPKQIIKDGDVNAVFHVVYQEDFETGGESIVFQGSGASVISSSDDVLDGDYSLKLSDGGKIILPAARLMLQPYETYSIDFDYHILNRGDSPTDAFSSAMAVFVSWEDGASDGFLLGSLFDNAYPLEGDESFTIKLGDVTGCTFELQALHAGDVVIDNISVVKHDVTVAHATPVLPNHPFPRTSKYLLENPTVTAMNNPVYKDEVTSILARFDLVNGVSAETTLRSTRWATTLQAQNKDMIILPYQQAFMMQDLGETSVEGIAGLRPLFNEGLLDQWYMVDTDGNKMNEPNYPQNFQMNFTDTGNHYNFNDYVHDFLHNNVLNTGYWDGIHFDQTEFYPNPLLSEDRYSGLFPPIDLNRDGIAETNSELHAAWINGFTDYFSLMGNSFGINQIIFGNAGDIPGNTEMLTYLNGWQREMTSPYPILENGDWDTSSGTQWYRIWRNYQAAQIFTRAPQMNSFEYTGEGLGTATGGMTANGLPQRAPTLEARDFRRMRLGLASTLLSDGYFGYDLVDNTSSPLWFDEYRVDASGRTTLSDSGRGYLGQPIGEAVELSYVAETIVDLDFESGSLPAGISLGTNTTIVTDADQVISGAKSLVASFELSDGFEYFLSVDPVQFPLEIGVTYQARFDYKVLNYTPFNHQGIPYMGFESGNDTGLIQPVSAAWYTDYTSADLVHTLRTSLNIDHSNIALVAGLQDAGVIVVDNFILSKSTGGVYRRDFEGGIVLVNPTPDTIFVTQAQIKGGLNRTGIKRILGLQDAFVNTGTAVSGGISLPSGDGIVLLADTLTRAIPMTPQNVNMIAATDDHIQLGWDSPALLPAGYLFSFAEQDGDFCEYQAVGGKDAFELSGLKGGTKYMVKVAAYDFKGNQSLFSPPIEILTTGTRNMTPEISSFGETEVLVPGVTTAIPTVTGFVSGVPLHLYVNGLEAKLVSVTSENIIFIVPENLVGTKALVRVAQGGVMSPGKYIALYQEPVTPQATSRTFHMGMTSLPPEDTDFGYGKLYSTLIENGDIVAYSLQNGVPWPEAYNSYDYQTYPQSLKDKWIELKSRHEYVMPDHEIYLMLNPIALSYDDIALYWGEESEMARPAPFDKLGFGDYAVQRAYLQYCIAAIEYFKPKYLATSIEANIYMAKQYDQWDEFKVFNEFIYTQIKALYPDLLQFPTIHYEHMMGAHIASVSLQEALADIYPDVLTTEVVDLLTFSDLFAVSTYPFMVIDNPVTPTYYDLAYQISEATDKRIAIDQTGYISDDFFFEPFNYTFEGSEALQNNFIQILLQQAVEHEFEFIINFVGNDYGTNYGTFPTSLTWAWTGIVDEDGSWKPATYTWNYFFNLDLEPAETLADGYYRVGDVTNVTMHDTGALLTLEKGLVSVEFLASDIVRLRFSPESDFNDSGSSAVSYDFATHFEQWTHIENEYSVIFETTQLSVQINKSPYHVKVIRADGEVILEDIDGGIEWSDQSGLVINTIKSPTETQYFGLGLRGGPLDRRGDGYIMRNSDHGAYGEDSTPLYTSTPFYYGENNGQFFGIFLDNPAQSFFNMDQGGTGEIQFGAQKGELDTYIMAGPTPTRVANAFSRITGKIPLPPKWSLGFHQSRYGYQSFDEIIDIAEQFRALDIPADAIYFDLDYLDDEHIFTWDPIGFPDPKANNLVLDNLGFKRVNIVDPAIKIDDPLWSTLDENGYFLSDQFDNTLVNDIFLGTVSWLDFTKDAAAAWYQSKLKTFLQDGVSGIWNDLNEPAQNFMDEAIYDFNGLRLTDLQARNVYALEETTQTQDAMLSLRPNERPFILSRSGYPGIQRNAATWSGDTLSTFDSLRVSVQMSNHMALSGQVQFGHDIGGFYGSPSAELFIRWLEFGAVTPFFRNHALNTTDMREPWLFGDPYTDMARDIINFRYQFMPTMYSLFQEASTYGIPVLRPVFFEFPFDENVYDLDEQFLIGPSVLVAPVLAAAQTTQSIYLPTDTNWFDYYNGQKHSGGQSIQVDAPLGRLPMMVAEGGILVTGPIQQYVSEVVAPYVDVHVYGGTSGQFLLYEDDGISLDYQTGDYLKTRIEWTQAATEARLLVNPLEGTWAPGDRPWLFTLEDFQDAPSYILYNGVALSNVLSDVAFAETIEGYYFDNVTKQIMIKVANLTNTIDLVISK